MVQKIKLYYDAQMAQRKKAHWWRVSPSSHRTELQAETKRATRRNKLKWQKSNEAEAWRTLDTDLLKAWRHPCMGVWNPSSTSLGTSYTRPAATGSVKSPPNNIITRPNGVPYKPYKNRPKILGLLWYLMRTAWRKQVIPSEWQIAVAVFIPKEAKSKDISQFRSIALLNGRNPRLSRLCGRLYNDLGSDPEG